MMGELSQREAYGLALADYGEKNPQVMALDVDTSASTLSHFFAKKYPDRFINIGIAEPAMIDWAVGLSLSGYIPFANGFAALLSLRAMEQIRTNLCYARTNVKLAASYAGLSDYKDGPTHHAILDIDMMRVLPNMTVIVPADAAETTAWVPVIAEMDGPVYLRISRAATLAVHEGPVNVAPGKGELLKPGNDAAIITCGAMAGRSMLAAKELAESGINVRVINMASIKPLDEGLVLQAAEETQGIITVEEHSVIGGLGGAVSELLAEKRPTLVRRVGIKDRFAHTAPEPESLMDAMGLGVGDIKQAVTNLLENAKSR